jgi:hypothetical protein
METGHEVIAQNQAEPELAETQAPAQKTERVFRQEDVNEIVKRAKYDAVESFKRKTLTQPEYAEQRYGQPVTQNTAGLPENEIRRLAAEEAQRLHENLLGEYKSKNEAEQARLIVEKFYTKVNSGKEKYADFDEVTGDMELKQFPNVVQMLAEHVENSGDVLYELGRNRLKLAQLEALSERSPRDAIREARRLADSIRDNEKADSYKQPNAPLSQQRPSNVATESGPLSASDYRAIHRKRYGG